LNAKFSSCHTIGNFHTAVHYLLKQTLVVIQSTTYGELIRRTCFLTLSITPDNVSLTTNSSHL